MSKVTDLHSQYKPWGLGDSSPVGTAASAENGRQNRGPTDTAGGGWNHRKTFSSRPRDSPPPTHRTSFKRQTTGNHSSKSARKASDPMTSFYLLVVLVDVPVGEPLPAELALVGLVFTVDDLVGAHLVQPLEGFVTNLACIGPLLCGKRAETVSSDLHGVKDKDRDNLTSYNSSWVRQLARDPHD